MDYFTKWVEAKAVATITDGQVKRFVWDNIVCRFGIPERANRSLGEGIKARLGEGNKNWMEEFPHVLWAYRTMIKSSHGDTPFSLTYGTEAVISAEIRMPTYRTVAVDVVNNDKELCLNLDLLEERRERAAVCEARAKSKMMKYYNARVRGVAFKPGDFVYRSNDDSHTVAGGKLGPKWEGPYEVKEALGNGAYKLQSTDGTKLPRTKRPGRNTPECYIKPLDSLKNWNNRFFWVDERVFPTVVDWRTNAPKDGMPAEGTYSIEAVRALDMHRTPIQKQSKMLLCLVRISRRYYLGDEVTNCHSLTADMDLFNLIRALNPTKVPLLTLTAPRVIEMDEPAATDSSGVPSTIERSPLDFAHEAGASDQGAAAPERPSSEDVPATAAPGAGQAEETATMDPPAAT
nr:reverse transcriptase domain-containing protein [Tanacetum cinerariifolium]